MKKANLLFFTDTAALILFVILAATGSLIYLILPPGTGHGSQIWGLGRHAWGTLHFWIALAFILLMVVHLFLHWGWIKTRVAGRQGEFSLHNIRVRLALYAIMAAVLLIILLFCSTPQPGNGAEHGPFLTLLLQ